MPIVKIQDFDFGTVLVVPLQQEAVHWFGPNSVTRVASGSSFLSLPAVKMADAGLYWCSSTSSISGGDVILSAVDLQVSSSKFS